MPTSVASRAALLSLAAASALTLADAPAHATATTPALPATLSTALSATVQQTTAHSGSQPASHETVAGPAAKRAKWYNIRHDSHSPTKSWVTRLWERPRGARVMQIRARCWGGDTPMTVTLQYHQGGRGWRKAKAGRWDCNGAYGTVRIHNAGHKYYRAVFQLNRRHTIEYWAQYYQ
ncbi:hypothetical protein ACSNOI_40340 [Actinomadura kijaniata]|uniref:hypothetical protein n=1 Tax=Actinomadura kijaniata TaxID=46161 RepID=UPI003F1E3FDF